MTKVSVIVPVFNGERFLEETLQSIYTQDYPELEIILVDDGSTDSTPTIAQRHAANIVYLRQENRGPAAATNLGLRRSSGEIVSFLDADDYWAPGMLRSLLGSLAADPSLDIAVGLTQRVQREGLIAKPFSGFYLSSSLMKRSVFERAGYLDEKLRFSEDSDWCLRALEKGIHVAFFPILALYYRQHEANLTLDREATLKNYVAAIKRSLDRRRAAQGSVSELNLTRFPPM